MMKWVVIFAIGLLLGLTIIGGAAFLLQKQGFHGTEYHPAEAAANFTLQSNQGAVKLSDYEDRVVVIYFGYTHCYEICPATITKAKSAIERLGSRGEQVQLVMVTVDPERDDANTLGEYMRRFDPSFVGLTGSVDEITAVAKSYGVYFQKREPDADGNYAIDQSNVLLAVDKGGRLRLLWSFEAEEDEIADDLEKLVMEGK